MACVCKKLTADGQVTTGKTLVCGVVAIPDGTNAVTVLLRDGVSVAAPDKMQTVSGTAKSAPGILFPSEGVIFNDGVFLSATTAGSCEVYIYYS